jgi:hypothetical protein
MGHAMSLSRLLYRALSLNNDLKAARRGPNAMLKRAVRKALYRQASKIINRATR